MSTSGKDAEFRRWLEEVDELCMRSYSLSIHDLPDMAFYDSFEDGASPEQFMEEHLPDLAALGSLILS